MGKSEAQLPNRPLGSVPYSGSRGSNGRISRHCLIMTQCPSPSCIVLKSAYFSACFPGLFPCLQSHSPPPGWLPFLPQGTVQLPPPPEPLGIPLFLTWHLSGPGAPSLLTLYPLS